MADEEYAEEEDFHFLLFGNDDNDGGSGTGSSEEEEDNADDGDDYEFLLGVQDGRPPIHHQGGDTCVFHAITFAAEMEMRRRDPTTDMHHLQRRRLPRRLREGDRHEPGRPISGATGYLPLLPPRGHRASTLPAQRRSCPVSHLGGRTPAANFQLQSAPERERSELRGGCSADLGGEAGDRNDPGQRKVPPASAGGDL